LELTGARIDLLGLRFELQRVGSRLPEELLTADKYIGVEQ
jgi:hypothetical protein